MKTTEIKEPRLQKGLTQKYVTQLYNLSFPLPTSISERVYVRGFAGSHCVLVIHPHTD